MAGGSGEEKGTVKTGSGVACQRGDWSGGQCACDTGQGRRKGKGQQEDSKEGGR